MTSNWLKHNTALPEVFSNEVPTSTAMDMFWGNPYLPIRSHLPAAFLTVQDPYDCIHSF